MTSKTQPWFRLYSEVLSDRKILRVVASSGQPKALVIGVWVTLLSLANDSPKRGYLLIADDMPLTGDEIIAETGLPAEMGSAIIGAFVTANMLRLEGDCFVIAHWDERQFVSDTSAERVRSFRERQKGDLPPPAPAPPPGGNPPPNGTGPVTFGYTKRYSNVTVTPPDTESESDTESEGERVESYAPPNFDEIARKALIVYSETSGLKLDRTQAAAVTDLIKGDSDFSLTRWVAACTSTKLAGVLAPNVACRIDTYKAGGNYQAMRDRRGNGQGQTNGSLSHSPKLDNAQIEAYRAQLEADQAIAAETRQRVAETLNGGIKAAGIDVEREIRRENSKRKG